MIYLADKLLANSLVWNRISIVHLLYIIFTYHAWEVVESVPNGGGGKYKKRNTKEKVCRGGHDGKGIVRVACARLECVEEDSEE